MGIFSGWHWVVLLIVVVLVFGTKKIKNLGTDVGESIKGFRKAMHEEEKAPEHSPITPAVPTPPVNPLPANVVPPAQPQPLDQPAPHVVDPLKKD